MNDSAQSEIRRLADGIRHALALEDDRISPDVRADASSLLERADDRLDLGEDFTVVAFAGSTGSGKSSLFNAVAGLDIARVGVRRPTTSRPTACVWGEGGQDILNWLRVPERSRTWRESALDGDDQRRLHGLILLDLPDHDSTAVEHRVESDRLVGLVDVVFWVVDPQKYADFSLHSEYLTKLAENSSNMVVVLNQVDKLSVEEQKAA
ncbi:ABC transporter, partial [Geobacillus sp. MMMUD3]|nr:ABC transporter [Geobacillus sp. MMMUD3]